MLVAEHMSVRVSRHFNYNYFGVRGRYDTMTRTGAYVNSLEPGTGFFVHESDSRSYRRFINEQKALIKQSFWTLILGKEPNYDKMIARTEKTLDGSLDEMQKTILVTYLNVLQMARDEEAVERIVRGIKDRMKGRPDKVLTSVLSHYKSSIATYQHEIKGVQINIEKCMDEASLKQWEDVVENFYKLMTTRRLWHVQNINGRNTYNQVFFDLGIFDFIQSPFDTPVMRDINGNKYYLYPQGIISARNNCDFDFIPMSNLEFQYAPVDLNNLQDRPDFSVGIYKQGKKSRRSKYHTDALSNLYATTSKSMTIGQLHIPQLGLTIYCNHTREVEDFVKSINAFKNLGLNLDFKPIA